MDLSWPFYLLMLVAGFAAGIVNTLAGSGSVFTLSLLLFSGMPADIANGTNRVGVTVQSLIGSYTFFRGDKLPILGSLPYTIPALLGAMTGAMVVAEIDEGWLEKIIGGVFIMMLALILTRPKQPKTQNQSKSSPWLIWPVFFAIGFYGGFIQAGIGILLVIALNMLSGYDLIEANAVEILIVTMYTVPVLGIFVYNQQVEWVSGVWLAVGQGTGSYLASKFALKKKNAVHSVRTLLIVMIILTILRSFGVTDWLMAFFSS